MNRKAGEVGYQTDIRCADLGKKEHPKGCLANQALKEQTTNRLVAYFDYTGSVLDSYWIPLADSDELYVHYGADITEWASERLFPKQCDGGVDCAACSCG